MRIKRLCAIILSITILFQSLAFTEVNAYDLSEALQGDVLEDGKDYRLIVELQGEPVISEAINRGLEFEELDESIIEEATQRIHDEQQSALSDLSGLLGVENKIEIATGEELPTYSINFNGFVVKGQKNDIELLKQKPYVKNVYVSQEYERPQLKHSNLTIGSSYAWNTLGYKGENTVIAIIDTGVDYTHEAMRLDAGAQQKYDRLSIDALISEHGLKGRYFSEKVPYGYNYYDHNSNTFDSYGSMHGMHVAGISAANSETSGVKGVAPNAQILAMKVFSDDVQYPTTFTDVWLKALDDAIKLKADVINMSLGAPAGIVSSDGNSLEELAITRAKQAGILVSVSAGNDGHLMSGHHHKDTASAENPDTALIAALRYSAIH